MFRALREFSVNKSTAQHVESRIDQEVDFKLVYLSNLSVKMATSALIDKHIHLCIFFSDTGCFSS